MPPAHNLKRPAQRDGAGEGSRPPRRPRGHHSNPQAHRPPAGVRAAVSAPGGALTVRAYAGDGSVMLCFSLDTQVDAGATTDLAGFAIVCTPPDGAPYTLANRLSFDTQYTKATTSEDRTWAPSTEAPIQKFNWLTTLTDDAQGPYRYDCTALYFGGDSEALREGAAASVTVQLGELSHPNLKVGFTRGYLSSQAYAERFGNAEIRPEGTKSIDYDTAQYLAQYQWLGYHARELVFAFLEECRADSSVSVDVFTYDFDEPDVIRALEQLGPRLRLYQDNAKLHVGPEAVEPLAVEALRQSAGAQNIETGHFKRFAHDKVMIQKRGGKAVKVLTGSANFSVRGLYVQANSVLVFDDPATADYYEQAFEQAFTDASGFAKSGIAAGWIDVSSAGVPPFSVSFAPHLAAEVSLQKVADAINGAKSSVLFAIMTLTGGGAVIDAIKAMVDREDILTYGMTQTKSGAANIFPPNSTHELVASFSALTKNVPEPFRAEWSGGAGQVIHHKFVVVDFNTDSPWVFCGSSNLSAGGEVSNGDNLLAFNDPEIARMYAVEAIRLIDHYQFRGAMQSATKSAPLALVHDDSWCKPYYDPKNLRWLERTVLALD